MDLRIDPAPSDGISIAELNVGVLRINARQLQAGLVGKEQGSNQLPPQTVPKSSVPKSSVPNFGASVPLSPRIPRRNSQYSPQQNGAINSSGGRRAPPPADQLGVGFVDEEQRARRSNQLSPLQTVPNSGASVSIPPRNNSQHSPQTKRPNSGATVSVPPRNNSQYSPQTGRQTGHSSGGRRAPPLANLPRSKHDIVRSRCCFCCLVVPFLLALALIAVFIGTFTVKDLNVTEYCSNISCSLNCDNQLKSTYGACVIIYSGGGVVGMMCILFVLTLTVRTCYGVKV